MVPNDDGREVVREDEARVLHHPEMLNPLGDPQPEAEEVPVERVEQQPAVTEEDPDAVEDRQTREEVVEPPVVETAEAEAFSQEDVDRLTQLARAEEGQRAAAEHAQFLQEQLRGQATVPAEPAPDHPLLAELEQAGIDPKVLDDYLGRRQEQFLEGLGNQVQQQNDAVTAAHEGVAKVYPDFSKAKLDAWMTDHPDDARVIDATQQRDLQGGLMAGWAMMGSAASEVAPVAGKAAVPSPRVGARGAAVASANQKIATRAPAQTWAEMNGKERQAFMGRLSKAPDGSAEEKRLLQVRFPGTTERVEANRGGQFAWKPEDY